MKRNTIKRLYRKKELADVEEKINLLGLQYREIKKGSIEELYLKMYKSPITYLNVRYITSFIIFAVTLYAKSNFSYIFAPILTILYFYLFYFVTITVPLKKRVKKLDHEALHFFEILTLTLESGRNLEHSIEITVDNVASEISKEFRKTLMEVRFGKALMEALEDMKRRIPSEVINNIILNITQTNVFGNNILETLYNQIDFLREKQILEIKGAINKIPNKISIISVLFIVPLILLLVLGPFIIQYL